MLVGLDGFDQRDQSELASAALPLHYCEETFDSDPPTLGRPVKVNCPNYQDDELGREEGTTYHNHHVGNRNHVNDGL